MKTATDPLCSLCPLGVHGIFSHMFWECPPIARFWREVATHLSDRSSVTMPVSVLTLILNNFSQLTLRENEKQIAGLRKTHCNVLEINLINHLILTFLHMEQPTACKTGAKEDNLNQWHLAGIAITL